MEMLKGNIVNLNDTAYYNNRELSWLAFNERVLQEAQDEMNPLLERLKFISIFSSNLDEFFMVRVAGLKDQVSAGFNQPENKAGLTPKKQLNKIAIKAHELMTVQYDTFKNYVLPALELEGIERLTFHDLTKEQREFIEEYFDEQIFPVLTPVAIDAYRPFPMLLNKSLNLATLLYDEKQVEEENRTKLGIVQVPSLLERFIFLPSEGQKHKFILLEDVISGFTHKLFTGYKVSSVTRFRITRNADLTIHEEGARDLLKVIEKELKKRKWGAAVRLEVGKEHIDERVLALLYEVLEVKDEDVYIMDGPLDLTCLFSLYKKLSPLYEHLVYPALIPQRPQDLGDAEDVFEKAIEHDILLHHPFESFQPVVDFVRDAADDPNVLAIKQTLYRVSGDSPIIQALKVAAEKGKQVTVLVELKARFDEENNVHWAKELEQAGCHVIYGVSHLKTHSKITLVVRRKNGKIERFVHLGTGNYNDATAKLYTDFGYITSRKDFGVDATNFFNYLSGYTTKPHFYHLSVAPFDIREQFIDLIDEEIRYHRQYGNGYIIAKMNSLTDKPLIKKMYEASQAGVKVELIVRGTCCLRPGIPNVSENIRVVSVVGRYLEHSRIYYFHHNGEEKIYLSSADWMTRNMEKRVEISFPILDIEMKARIKAILQLTLADNVKTREQNKDGDYYYVINNGAEEIDSQVKLFKMAYQNTDAE
ncbi:polyphosphate kinase [Bacillus paranthracis]|uniref:polyphosphate kinase n=1 Tax=Bacillus paranthracis TaxID=2026186 RepID=UPI000200F1AB|nr:polyphosphate kinase [Bacillus paranthracis]ADY23156.1 polyphosphate kinase [Bacillus thuringiensis serovar finitimus YBT-020]MRC70484.1 polyphosphate kinase [Bacillus thuringiensis]OTX66613.1 RNA degradosome polyphosphate kinase [Bacillus thuringiensis serovar finitimus]MCR6796684.1 polyphosphate kinase [Bacillus paranthracis]MEC3359898.1 polyphosphate kinase [Bacillus paranthracis]